MLGKILIENVWLSMGIWAALYILDYALTIIGAKMYHSGANKVIVFEKGYELTPYFQKDIALMRRFSPRFILALFLSCAGIWVVRVPLNAPPDIFAFLIGALIFLEVGVHVRHVKNLCLFRYAARSRGLKGHIEYSRWFSLRLSSIELFCFAVLFLLVFLLSNSFFVLGGVATCFVTALKHLRLSEKEKKRPIESKQSNAINKE